MGLTFRVYLYPVNDEDTDLDAFNQPNAFMMIFGSFTSEHTHQHRELIRTGSKSLKNCHKPFLLLFNGQHLPQSVPHHLCVSIHFRILLISLWSLPINAPGKLRITTLYAAIFIHHNESPNQQLLFQKPLFSRTRPSKRNGPHLTECNLLACWCCWPGSTRKNRHRGRARVLHYTHVLALPNQTTITPKSSFFPTSSSSASKPANTPAAHQWATQNNSCHQEHLTLLPMYTDDDTEDGTLNAVIRRKSGENPREAEPARTTNAIGMPRSVAIRQRFVLLSVEFWSGRLVSLDAMHSLTHASEGGSLHAQRWYSISPRGWEWVATVHSIPVHREKAAHMDWLCGICECEKLQRDSSSSVGLSHRWHLADQPTERKLSFIGRN